MRRRRLRDDEVINSSIDEVIIAEIRFYLLVGEVNERNVVSVMEITKKVVVNSSAIGYKLYGENKYYLTTT